MKFLTRISLLGIAIPGVSVVLFLAQRGIGSDDHRTVTMAAFPAKDSSATASRDAIPLPRREFRAAWVATVHNLDWPSRPGLSVNEMKREAVTILDRLADLNINAVIFQVRPQSDAFYRSSLEPWSCYLTGEQGRPPEASFDPLSYWIEQAHDRGLQLHAWFNPYRAYHGKNQGAMSPQFVVKAKPELVVKLRKDGYWWLNPALEKAREYTIKVILDVVSRYDIDGVHFDDYFYPYPNYNANREFPDSESFSEYRKQGGVLDIGDWRRDAVNQLVRDLYRRIKEEKCHVAFGISPFGIWQSGYPKEITGLDPYKVLYADSRLWLRSGWVDYLMPQLYWPIKSRKQSFPVLLKWWHDQNQQDRHLWPGLKITSSGELVDQIELVRQFQDHQIGCGMSVFSAKRLMRQDKDTARIMKDGPWSEPSLIPSFPWCGGSKPLSPVIVTKRNFDGSTRIEIHPKAEDVFRIILCLKKDGTWLTPSIYPGKFRTHQIDSGSEAIAVCVVNRYQNMSDPVLVQWPN